METAKIIAQSRQLAIEQIEKNVQEKNINCHFARRSWYAYTNEKYSPDFEHEIDILKKIGLPIEHTSDLPFSFPFKQAAVLSNQARFNPLQYVISMAQDLEKNGCLLFENTRVIHLAETNVCHLKTEKASVIAKKALMATHTPVGVNPTHFLTAPHRSYVVAVKLEKEEYPEGHCWNFDTPHYTVCTHAVSSNQPELLIIAGSHHKTGQNNSPISHYAELEKILKKCLKVKETAYHWSAQHYHSADNLPYIGLAGHSYRHTYLATGYWADGLVYGTLAGMIISDLMLKKENQYTKTYRTPRLKISTSLPFIAKENINIFAQYLKDFPLFSSLELNVIKAGEGKIIEIRQEKYAVSRNKDNQLQMISAVCPHMKCIVKWNDEEKTWDCPCHGSRFTCEGQVIEGPALLPLENKSKCLLTKK